MGYTFHGHVFMMMKLAKTVMLGMCLSAITLECMFVCTLCCLKEIFKTSDKFSENNTFQNLLLKNTNSLSFKTICCFCLKFVNIDPVGKVDFSVKNLIFVTETATFSLCMHCRSRIKRVYHCDLKMLATIDILNFLFLY